MQRGDLDAFFGLFLNNLIDILLVTNLCLFALNFSAELVFQRVLPGLALGVLIGNLWFYLEAKKLTRLNPATRVCALPYGVNLLPIFLFTFYVMYPAQQFALSQGLSATQANQMAWLAGIAGCVLSGIAELLVAVVAPWLQKNLPPAAMLTALAAIGLLFIGADYFTRSYHYPLVGLPVLFLMIYLYAGRVQLRFNLPAGLIILLVGVALAWLCEALGIDGPIAQMANVQFEAGLHLPQFAGLQALPMIEQAWQRLDVLIPIALFSTLGSLVVVEAARAIGDPVSMKGALSINGVGSITAGLFGSPYPTTVYLGHVAWKAVGAGHAYSLMSGAAVALLCFTGSFALITKWIPIEAGMAILVWVGVSVCGQAIAGVDKRYAPAVALGLMPGVAAFAATLMLRSFTGAGLGDAGSPITTEFLGELTGSNIFATGVFALEKGWMMTSLLVTAIAIACIDGNFRTLVIWLVAAALFALAGISHKFEVLDNDVVSRLGPAWDWVFGYLIATLVIVAVHLGLRVKATEEATIKPLERQNSRQ